MSGSRLGSTPCTEKYITFLHTYILKSPVSSSLPGMSSVYSFFYSGFSSNTRTRVQNPFKICIFQPVPICQHNLYVKVMKLVRISKHFYLNIGKEKFSGCLQDGSVYLYVRVRIRYFSCRGSVTDPVKLNPDPQCCTKESNLRNPPECISRKLVQSYRNLTSTDSRNRMTGAKTLDQTTQYRKTNHWPILLKL